MSSDLHTQLSEAEKSFKRACEQIIHLNRRLDEMAKRYEKASRENHRSFRYSLRLRMAVSEGVRNMYYEYAANKADLISDLRYKVADSTGRTVTPWAVHPNSPQLRGGERRERESTRDRARARSGVNGTSSSSRRTANDNGLDNLSRMNDSMSMPRPKTSRQRSIGNSSNSNSSASQSAENQDAPQSSLLPPVEGVPVSQYDSSDMDSPSDSAEMNVAVMDRSTDEELVESMDLVVEPAVSAENSSPVRTRSNSPLSCDSSP